jgi:ABC-type glutathione transport system ATPase component
MDEYLDKVIPSVRSKFYKTLQALIANIPMKIIIITHSKSVLQEITEKIVVIKVLTLYYISHNNY